MGRVVLYTPQGASLGEVLSLQEKALRAGVQATECAAGLEWSAVLLSLEQGDEFVVESLDCFSSLNELLGFVAQSGARVRSLAEQWFSDPITDPQDYQRRLYELGSSLHAARTHRGLHKAALEGRKPGRKLGSKSIQPAGILKPEPMVETVDALRAEQHLTVGEACRQAGISVKVYYQKRELHKV